MIAFAIPSVMALHRLVNTFPTIEELVDFALIVHLPRVQCVQYMMCQAALFSSDFRINSFQIYITAEFVGRRCSAN